MPRKIKYLVIVDGKTWEVGRPIDLTGAKRVNMSHDYMILPFPKVKWSKEIPKEEGWYWIRYRGKHGWVRCPCTVMHFKDGTNTVATARNDFFVEGPRHGGKGLKCHGKLDKNVSFGPKIPEPK